MILKPSLQHAPIHYKKLRCYVPFFSFLYSVLRLWCVFHYPWSIFLFGLASIRKLSVAECHPVGQRSSRSWVTSIYDLDAFLLCYRNVIFFQRASGLIWISQANKFLLPSLSKNRTFFKNGNTRKLSPGRTSNVHKKNKGVSELRISNNPSFNTRQALFDLAPLCPTAGSTSWWQLALFLSLPITTPPGTLPPCL